MRRYARSSALLASDWHSASPRHPLASRRDVRIRDLGGEPFVVHHLCASTEQTVLRLFEQYETRCHIVAELWSFENIKSFAQGDVGPAIVPRITVQQEFREKRLVKIPVRELNIPRHTLMVYRSGYISDAARELIKVVASCRKSDLPETLPQRASRAKTA